MRPPGPGGTSEPSKVERVIETYDLEHLGDELERRWTADGTERESLRDLADYMNRRILESAVQPQGESLHAEEIERLFEQVQGTAGTASSRVEAEATLQRLDVDVDGVRADFVSHQTVYTYLTETRGVELDDDSVPADPAGNRRAVVQRLRSRLGTVTEESIRALAAADHLSIGEFEVIVGVTVHCADCGSTHDVSTLLANGDCGCQPGPS